MSVEAGRRLLAEGRGRQFVEGGVRPFVSTLPCPGYSIWNAWKGGWIPWNGDGLHGMGDGFHGIGDGFHTFGGWIPWNGGWIPYIFQMDSIHFPDGFHTFSMEWGMDSILFQDGIHGMGDGLNNFFYLFHKSRLKIYMVGI